MAMWDLLARRRKYALRGGGALRDAAPVIGMEMPLLAFDGPSMQMVQEAPAFDRALRYFDGYPAAGNLDGRAHAILFVLVRLARPRGGALVEGTFPALAEVVARALWENAKGILHVPGQPGDLAGWPEVLKAKVKFHRPSVLDALAAADARVDLVVLPGAADVAANAHALRKAQRILRPGGIVVLSSLSRPVLEAAQDFVAENLDWGGLGRAVPDYDRSRPASPISSSLPGTPFVVIQRKP